MTRLFLALIAVVGALAVVPYAVEAQKATKKKDALPKFNQVYVKIIWFADLATRHTDRPVVESWIAEQLKKRGESKFTAVTAWLPLVHDEGTFVFAEWGCPVYGVINERADGRIKVSFDGWAPVPGFGVTVSLKDEPGSRAVAAVEKLKTKQGMPYVAVLIGPPPEKSAAPTDPKK